MSELQVFGATGAVGRFLLERLRADARRVNAVTRRPMTMPAQPDALIDWSSFDLWVDRAPTFAELMISVGPLDAMVHWLSRIETPNLRTLVALSSMSVESKRDAIDAEERALASRIVAAESQLIALCDKRNIRWTILRPTLIWGTGMDHSLTPLYQFAHRYRIAPVPMAVGGLRQPVHADDVAQACLQSLAHDVAANQIIPVGGGEVLSVSAMWRRVITAAKATRLPMPRALLMPLTHLLSARGASLRASWQRWNQDQIAPMHPALNAFGLHRKPFHPTPRDFAVDARNESVGP